MNENSEEHGGYVGGESGKIMWARWQKASHTMPRCPAGAATDRFSSGRDVT